MGENQRIDYDEYMSRFYQYRRKCLIHELIVMGLAMGVSLILIVGALYLFGVFE